MGAVKERYMIDEAGNKTAVVLDIEEYQKILGELEELEAIHAYDEAKADSAKPVPFADAARRLGISK